MKRNGIISWWAGNSVAANLLMVGAVLAGVVGFFRMEQEVFPTAGWNGVSITTSWPGASPQDIEEQIVVRIEEALADLEGIEELTATAREGFASVNIEASRSVDMDVFINDVKLRVDSVNNLPQDSFEPSVQRWEASQWFLGIVVHGDLPERDLKRITDQVREEIASLPGASRTQTWATLDEEVTIELSETALRRYSLTFDEVAAAIRGQSINTSAGTVRTDVGNVQLGARQLADSAQDFEEIIVRQEPNGAVIRVGDVARVIDGFIDAEMEASFNGEPMALVAVLATQNDMNVNRTVRAARDYMEERADTLPEGVSLELWWDDSKIFRDRMTTIGKSAIMGLTMVFITLMLFLRPWVAFWVTVGIATAFAGTFAVLVPLGVSLNILSLFAFLLVIGIIVDDAIIVGENIHNQIERGEKGVDASIIGTQLVAKPVLFAVITTMMVFAPWMLLTGPEVQFTKQISLVVIAALSFSLIEAFLILPAHLSHMKKQGADGRQPGPLMRMQGVFADSLVAFSRNVYRPIVETAIRLRYATFALFLGFFVLTVAAMSMGFVRFSFMPEVENEFIFVNIQMPDGTPFSRVQEIRGQFEIAQQTLQDEFNERFGDEVPLVESRNSIATDGQIQAWIGLAPPEIRPGSVSSSEVSDRLRELLGEVPDAEEITVDFTINDEGGGLRFALFSPDLDALRLAAEDIKAQLRTYGDTFDVTDNFQSSTDELQFDLLPGARSLGLTLNDVTRQVRQAYYGEEVQRLPRAGDDVRVMLRFPESDRRSLDSLNGFRIRTADGREVPLSSIAEVDFAPGINTIRRRERQRSITVSAEVSGEGLGDIRDDLQESFWPEWRRRHPNVTEGDIGSAQDQQEFLAEVMMLQGIVLVAMYFLLAVAFKSYFQPLLIMTAIPFAIVGAVIGHVIYGIPLALFSFFGIAAAAGVVINDNLVLVDFVNRLRDRDVGAFQALVEAGVARFRPILLTSVTTFLGVLPLIAERSTQAQFLKPMVIALGFAVLFALFLSLILVPALYAIGTDVARFFRWGWSGAPMHFIGSGYDPDMELHGDMGVDDDEDNAVPDPDGHPAPAE